MNIVNILLLNCEKLKFRRNCLEKTSKHYSIMAVLVNSLLDGSCVIT